MASAAAGVGRGCMACSHGDIGGPSFEIQASVAAVSSTWDTEICFTDREVWSIGAVISGKNWRCVELGVQYLQDYAPNCGLWRTQLNCLTSVSGLS